MILLSEDWSLKIIKYNYFIFAFFSHSPTGSLTDLSSDITRPGYWGTTKNGKTQSSYQLVNVDETSEMLSNVRNLFSRSMIGKTYEIISVKSVQNPLLWTKFVR